LNVDLSTVTTAADLAIGIGDPLREVLHMDFQSSAAADKDHDLLVYNSLLYRHYRVPVHTIIVLMRPQAAHSKMDGTVRYEARPGRGKMDFGYEQVRLWERPAEELLQGNLATAPLAMLGALPSGVELVPGLTGVAQRLLERLESEAPLEAQRKLLTTAFVLTGLRVQRGMSREVFRGVRAMRDSDTYMAIIDEGREEGMKTLILLLGQARFGDPDEPTRTQLQGITDIDRLGRIGVRLLSSSGWREALEAP
jgi:hypothetical protein